MPNTRRQSAPFPSEASSSSTPLRPKTPSTSTSTPRRSSARALHQRTPTPNAEHHHHKSADEIAAEEAEKILHHTPLGTARHYDLRGVSESSERDKRHLKLEEARIAREREGSGSRSRAGSTGVSESVQKDALPMIPVQEDGNSKNEDKEETASGTGRTDTRAEEHGNDEAGLDGAVPGSIQAVEDKSDIESDVFGTVGLELPEEMRVQDDAMAVGSILKHTNQDSDGQNEQPDREMQGTTISAVGNTIEPESSTTSESDSDDTDEDESSETSDTSEDEESDEDEEEEDEAMERLLEAARKAAIAKEDAKSKERVIERAEDEDSEVVLQFDASEGSKGKQAPIPDLTIPTLPKAHLTFDKNGIARAATHTPPVSAQAGPSRRRAQTGTIDESKLELDNRPYEKELSKREKAAQPRKATPSELWSALPAPRADRLPQMKRDYQALALANSLDPKRFMKGGKSATTKVPELFAIGTMVDAPRHLQDTTIQREVKYRPGQIVENLARDEGVGGYAKRKYGDLQGVRMDNGRGKGWKKRSKW